MSLIHNERVKLTAAWLNGLAGAAAAGGSIAPLIAGFYGVSGPPAGKIWFMAGIGFWLLIGGALHLFARYVLRNLKP